MASALNPLPGDKMKAPPLKKGDLIAVVAPAGPVHEAAFAGGVKVLENLGFRVKVGRHVAEQLGYLAGPDEGRAEDLNEALHDTDVRGIVCARGGYGCGRILNLVDYAAMRANPRVFVGYSDVTALHCAFARQVGLVTFHGPMVESLGGGLTRLTLESFVRAVTSAEPLDVLPMPGDYAPPQVVGAGRATGPLTGGNLSIIASLMGTPYELDARGRVLMLEDVGEEPYRIDRTLRQLALAGKLEQATGLVLGEMINCDYRPEAAAGPAQPPESAAPGARSRRGTRGPSAGTAPVPPASAAAAAPPTVPSDPDTPPLIPALFLGDVITDYFAGLSRPVISGLPCGHGRDKWTLPLGCVATVDGYKGRLIIEEAACEARD